MALSRVLDIYKRVASLRGQAPAKQNHFNSDKKVNSKPNGTGRSRYTACESPLITANGSLEFGSILRIIAPI